MNNHKRYSSSLINRFVLVLGFVAGLAFCLSAVSSLAVSDTGGDRGGQASSVLRGCQVAPGAPSSDSAGRLDCTTVQHVDDGGDLESGTVGGALVYICPMHPQVKAPQPGDCPLCGMHLLLADGPQDQEANPEPSVSVYSCPMHPQVVAKEPGDCPICGMHLKLARAE